jgi:hypothetical protein
MNKQEKREVPTYYGILPAEIRYSKLLSPMEKIMYAEISALASKTGRCWGSNSYFAELYDVQPTTVSEWINNLKRQGFVSITGAESKNRVITLVNILRKKPKTPKEIPEAQPTEKAEHNNTSINTITNRGTEPAIVVEEPFNFKVYLEGTLKNSVRVNNARFFSALFIKKKGLVFKDKRSLEAVIKQWLWAGKILGEFVGDLKKVEEAFYRAQNLEWRGQRKDWDLKDVINEIRKI